MVTFDNLPVLLVSASNETVAASVILELIDKDVTAEYNKTALSSDRVWRLVNKYYSADVRVHTLKDDGVLDLDPEVIEAHIIYISEEEMSAGVTVAEKRVTASRGAWRACDVRVLLVDSTGGAGAWGAWAAAARAELVPRREMAPNDVLAPEPFADAYGMERARAALHAHPWPNLVRTDTQINNIEALQQHIEAHNLQPLIVSSPIPIIEVDSDDEFDTEHDAYSDASSDTDLAWVPADSDSDADERFAVEHAEAFAAALGALANEPRGADVPAAVPRDSRLDRAEDLVLAFCRALGLDPDSA